MKPEQIRELRISLAGFGKVVGVTGQYVGQIAKERKIEKVTKSQYRFGDLADGWREDQKEALKRAGKTSTLSAVQEARTREIEQRIAERAGRLMPIGEVSALLDLIVGTVRAGLGGLSARITRDLMLRRDIDRVVNGILADIAKHLSALAEIAGKSGGILLTVADSAAGRLGGTKPDLSGDGGNPGAA